MKITIEISAIPEIDLMADELAEKVVKAAAAIIEELRQHVEYDVADLERDNVYGPCYYGVIMGVKARPENT